VASHLEIGGGLSNLKTIMKTHQIAKICDAIDTINEQTDYQDFGNIIDLLTGSVWTKEEAEDLKNHIIDFYQTK
jgi:hypothetical protein